MWKYLQRYLKKLSVKYRSWKEGSAKDEAGDKEATEKRWQFTDYIPKVPQIVLYMRREHGISRRNLELVVIDDADEPAWRIKEILKNLVNDPQVLYLATDRPEAFTELEEELMEGYGLPFVVLENGEPKKLPGNLVLDLNLWENQLDRFDKIWV